MTKPIHPKSWSREPVACRIRLRAYSIAADAVELGIDAGWNLAHEHAVRPGEIEIKARIESEVMAALCNVIAFDQEADET